MSFFRPAGLRGNDKGVPLSARRPTEPDARVLVIGGPIARVDVPGLCIRADRVLARGDGDLVCDVGALVDADAAVVEALARIQLTARGLGRRIQLRHAAPALRELIDFMGLEEALPELLVGL